MTLSFAVIVPLYKCSLESSATIQSLLRLSGIQFQLYLWDNSPDVLGDPAIAVLQRSMKVKYRHTPENISLAQIYNTIIGTSSEEIIVIFDQDTHFDNILFELASRALVENPEVNLFTPFIKEKNTIYSPGYFNGVKGRYWSRLMLGPTTAKGVVAVASGMFIRGHYLRSMKMNAFDEKFKLYGIDSDFFMEYGKRNKTFFILDYNLKHGLSINENESPEKKYFRKKDSWSATLKLARKQSYLHYCAALVYVSYLKLKYTLSKRL